MNNCQYILHVQSCGRRRGSPYLPTGVGSARSSMTWALIPKRARLAPSINPAGPAPTTQTWVCEGASGMLRRRVMRSTQLAPITPSVVSMLPSWLCVFSEFVSRMPGAIVTHTHTHTKASRLAYSSYSGRCRGARWGVVVLVHERVYGQRPIRRCDIRRGWVPKR